MWTTFRSVVRFRPLEIDPVQRRLRRAVNVEDYRRLARRRLPRGVFGYVDGGADDERTLARNVAAFGGIEFRPRVLRDVTKIDTSTELFGESLSMPLVLAPTGYTRLTHSAGELSPAVAAQKANVPYTLSTMATRSIEEVARAAPDASRWFQLYPWHGDGVVEDLLARARQAGYRVLVITVDLAVLGNRERDLRAGFTVPPEIGLGTLVDGVLHPGWTWDFLTHEPIGFANVARYGHAATLDEGSDADSLAMARHALTNFDRSLRWDDVDRLRELWGGPVVLKGIQTLADAQQAAEIGVDGIMLSNHGGRQLDDAPTPIELVEPVAAAVGERLTIICDGGIRRGSDIVKAIALGADACSIGRPYLYAAAIGGQAGVNKMLDFFQAGIANTLALCGVTSIAEVDRSMVDWKKPLAE